ncbi:transaldolase [Buchnera aphidicola (Thelaxes californica)]|uniref:Transaldolase n=1 Tax=Buchnera aphidicola (Thelaxes californica) TaxID=1315998 RepID=A0A4D6YJH7_9GAMM|nr:transaldolase [Buchnera aphidicola]QCI26631.1 transaldolase [Buchnera aphidicola (Thelaxes californica)]
MNQLDYLKKMSIVVADTGDIISIKKYQPQDATTNPSLILKAVESGMYNHLLQTAVTYSKKIGGTYLIQLQNAVKKLSVLIGIEILNNIPGRISTEVNAMFSFSYEDSLRESRDIINLYEESGINRSRILIKLAATWQCICAARELKKENIQCNLTLLFSFAQAKACADAQVFLISPFVGRIFDWYKNKNLLPYYSIDIDPGVLSVKKIFDYYKKNQYKTIIMAASFRTIEQVLALSGCDYLTISPELLQSLKEKKTMISLQLDKNSVNSSKIIPKFLFTESDFYFEHNQDAMAVEKLSEGIRQFVFDQKKLEKILSQYI